MKRAETRIAVFYPWTGLPALDRGSARRVVPLVRLLAERYDQIRVVSPGNGSDRWRSGNVEYHFQRPSTLERLWLTAAFMAFDGHFHHLFRGHISARERRQWWHYLQVDFQWNLKRKPGEPSPGRRSSCLNIRSGKRWCSPVARTAGRNRC